MFIKRIFDIIASLLGLLILWPVLLIVAIMIKVKMEGRVHSLHPTNWKRYNVEYILELFHNYYDKYIEAGTPIFSSYEAIGGFFNE